MLPEGYAFLLSNFKVIYSLGKWHVTNELNFLYFKLLNVPPSFLLSNVSLFSDDLKELVQKIPDDQRPLIVSHFIAMCCHLLTMTNAPLTQHILYTILLEVNNRLHISTGH